MSPQVTLGIAQFRYLMVCHAVFCLNQANTSLLTYSYFPHLFYFVFYKTGRHISYHILQSREGRNQYWKSWQAVWSASGVFNFFNVLFNIQQTTTQPSWWDGCRLLQPWTGWGEQKEAEEVWYREFQVNFQVNWEINYRGSSSVAFLRCMGQEETFRWPLAFFHLESISFQFFSSS